MIEIGNCLLTFLFPHFDLDLVKQRSQIWCRITL